LKAEHIAKLLNDQDRRYSRREAGDDRKGDELDGSAQSSYAERNQHHARHHGGDSEPVHSVALDDSVDDHDKCAGRATNLYSRATEHRDDEPGDHGSVEPTLRRQAAGDRECDGEWESHDSDDDACGKVRHELLAVVGLESGDELGKEH
jgi:hypothetical protein